MDHPFEGIPTVPPRKDVDHLVMVFNALDKSVCLQGQLIACTILDICLACCVDRCGVPCPVWGGGSG